MPSIVITICLMRYCENDNNVNNYMFMRLPAAAISQKISSEMKNLILKAFCSFYMTFSIVIIRLMRSCDTAVNF